MCVEGKSKNLRKRRGGGKRKKREGEIIEPGADACVHCTVEHDS